MKRKVITLGSCQERSQASDATKTPSLKVVRGAGTRMRGHHEGWLIATDDERAYVDYPNNPHGPLRARATLPLSSLRAAHALSQGKCAVLLVFERDAADQPVIVGLLDPVSQPTPEALIDGRRVTIEAHDEVVLRCGASSITLRRDGAVVIRGAYVETQAQGVNRIRGGSVQIN